MTTTQTPEQPEAEQLDQLILNEVRSEKLFTALGDVAGGARFSLIYTGESDTVEETTYTLGGSQTNEPPEKQYFFIEDKPGVQFLFTGIDAEGNVWTNRRQEHRIFPATKKGIFVALVRHAKQE